MTGPVWLACPEFALPAASDWLSPGEVDYAARQRFTKRRDEFLVARFTAKTAIAGALGLDPTGALRRVEIRHEPSGAPMACVDGAPARVQVSLTDRAGWAACLVSDHPARVGCDLELVEPRSPGFVADYLTEVERRHVDTRPDADAAALAANLTWSAKEAALKVLTTGLRRDTRSVEVALGDAGDGWQPMTVTADGNVVLPGWWCRLGSFVLTVAAAAPLPPPRPVPSPWQLAAATPTHSWLARPTVDGQRPAAAIPRSSASMT